MKTLFISFLNIVAVIPIFALIIVGPLAFIMSFDAPGSESDAGVWLFRITIFGVIPLAVMVLIFLSQKNKSILLALIAMLPTMYLTYDMYVKPRQSLTEFNDSVRDFECAGKAYLTREEVGFGTPIPEMQWVTYHQKEAVNRATIDRVGAIYKDHYIPRSSLKYTKNIHSPELKTDILSCKNAEGKEFQEVYPQASADLIEELNQKIEARK